DGDGARDVRGRAVAEGGALRSEEVGRLLAGPVTGRELVVDGLLDAVQAARVLARQQARAEDTLVRVERLLAVAHCHDEVDAVAAALRRGVELRPAGRGCLGTHVVRVEEQGDDVAEGARRREGARSQRRVLLRGLLAPLAHGEGLPVRVLGEEAGPEDAVVGLDGLVVLLAELGWDGLVVLVELLVVLRADRGGQALDAGVDGLTGHGGDGAADVGRDLGPGAHDVGVDGDAAQQAAVLALGVGLRRAEDGVAHTLQQAGQRVLRLRRDASRERVDLNDASGRLARVGRDGVVRGLAANGGRPDLRRARVYAATGFLEVEDVAPAGAAASRVPDAHLRDAAGAV